VLDNRRRTDQATDATSSRDYPPAARPNRRDLPGYPGQPR